MAVKTYRAKNMHEAFAMIRRDLGIDATLLETREIPARRIFGMSLGEACVEVTATNDAQDALPEESSVETFSTFGAFSSSEDGIPDRWFSDAPSAKENPAQFSAPSFSPEPKEDSSLLFGGSGFFQQIAGAVKMPKSEERSPFKDALLEMYAKLQTADMCERSITELVERLREDETLYAAASRRAPNADARFLTQKLQEFVAQEIQTTGPIAIQEGKRQTVALVGPTGVGKTTTIAKLAIDYRQRRGCHVGLITLDLSRMGAVEQLQTFADVIGIPMLCASTRRQMREAIARMADFDLVLIDTAGQSRVEEISLQEMRMFFDEAQVNDVMLVLSSTARTRVLQRTAESFAPLGTTSLILTKLDESLGLGNLYPLLQTSALPVSYITNGQKVPDDFEVAESKRLAKLLLGDETIQKQV